MSEIISEALDAGAAWQRAVDELRAGGVVVVPTDTVYGIAADAFNLLATGRIFALKRRPRSLPLPVLVSRPRQAWALAASVPQAATDLAAEYWPGALTLIVPQTPDLPWDLGRSAGKIALRMPMHQGLLSLLESVGPVAATSANVSGEPTPRTVAEIYARLGDGVGVYVDGGEAPTDKGSTIVDVTGPVPLVVREGPIAVADIERVTGESVARA